jgi:hypothetical protein
MHKTDFPVDIVLMLESWRLSAIKLLKIEHPSDSGFDLFDIVMQEETVLKGMIELSKSFDHVSTLRWLDLRWNRIGKRVLSTWPDHLSNTTERMYCRYYT